MLKIDTCKSDWSNSTDVGYQQTTIRQNIIDCSHSFIHSSIFLIPLLLCSCMITIYFSVVIFITLSILLLLLLLSDLMEV